MVCICPTRSWASDGRPKSWGWVGCMKAFLLTCLVPGRRWLESWVQLVLLTTAPTPHLHVMGFTPWGHRRAGILAWHLKTLKVTFQWKKWQLSSLLWPRLRSHTAAFLSFFNSPRSHKIALNPKGGNLDSTCWWVSAQKCHHHV